jgi:hypothetical protein
MAHVCKNDAVDILRFLGCNLNNICGFQIDEFPDGRVEASFSWNSARWSPDARPPSLSWGKRVELEFLTSSQNRGPRRRNKTPAKRRRDKARLLAFIARKKESRLARHSPTNTSVNYHIEESLTVTSSITINSPTLTETNGNEIVGHTPPETECGRVVDVLTCDNYTNSVCELVESAVECDLAYQIVGPVHTVPSLPEILPTLTPVEVGELATSFNQDLMNGLKEYKVNISLLELLKSRSQPADVAKYRQLEQRAVSLGQRLRVIQSQSDLIDYYVKLHTSTGCRRQDSRLQF